MNNVVIHNCVYGIHLWHAAGHATIVNNTVAYNLGGGMLIGTGDAPAIRVDAPEATTIRLLKITSWLSTAIRS